MTIILDSYPLTIQLGSFHERLAFSGKDQYVWKDSAIKLQHKSYGAVESWSFTAFEDANAVAWVDSAAYHLLTHVANGVAVAFVFSSLEHSVPDGQLVYVNNVKVHYSSDLKIRYFDCNARAV